jgi:anti-sigma-K factor RskA
VSAGDDDRLRDDAAAWVLGALDESEAAAFARRLERSRAARDEVDELREAADALSYAVEPVGPPPELRDRIMAIVESEAEVLRAAGARADRVAEAPRTPWWRSLLRPVPVAALACTLVLAGVVAGLLVSGESAEPTRTVAAQVSGNAMADASARLEIEGGHAELVVEGMRSPGAGRVYQVWFLHEGRTEPVPAGALFDVDREGHGTAALPGELGNVSEVMVSVEPAGGSELPTADPVISARLG